MTFWFAGALLSLAGGTVPATEPTVLCLPTATVGFADRWDYCAQPPPIAPASEAVSGQVVSFFTAIEGARVNAAGAVAVRYDITVTAPNGSVYRHADNLRLEDRPVRRPGAEPAIHDALLPAQELLTFAFEPDDPLGEYRIEVRVNDVVAGARASAEATVEHVAYAPAAFEGIDLLEWVQCYGYAPEPNLLAAAAERASRETNPARTALFTAFFEACFELNPGLAARWSQELQALGEDVRQRALVRALIGSPAPRPIGRSAQLGRFLATRSFTDALELCKAIGVDSDELRRRLGQDACDDALRHYCRAMLAEQFFDQLVEAKLLMPGSRASIHAALERD